MPVWNELLMDQRDTIMLLCHFCYENADLLTNRKICLKDIPKQEPIQVRWQKEKVIAEV